MRIPKDISVIAESAVSCIRLIDDEAKSVRFLEQILYRERLKYADIAGTVDLFENGKLKNSDPRQTCAEAVISGNHQ